MLRITERVVVGCYASRMTKSIELTELQQELVASYTLWVDETSHMIKHLSNPGDRVTIHLTGTPVGSSSGSYGISIKMDKSDAIKIVEHKTQEQYQIAQDAYDETLQRIFASEPIAVIAVGYSSAVSAEQQATERTLAPKGARVTVTRRSNPS